MPLSKELQKLGVKEADATVYPRLIVAISAHDQKGKTNFGLTAPSPSIIISSDIGTEGVVDKFKAAGKEIYEHNWTLPRKQKDAENAWKKVEDVLEAAYTDSYLRSIVIDTESELWQLLRLYKLGKLEKVPSYKYGEVNAIAGRIFKKAYVHKKNLILLRKLKPIYIGKERTNNYEPSGYEDVKHIAQVTALAGRNKRTKTDTNPDFNLTITKCRHKPELEGEVYEGHEVSFPWLATEVLPNTDMSDWE